MSPGRRGLTSVIIAGVLAGSACLSDDPTITAGSATATTTLAVGSGTGRPSSETTSDTPTPPTTAPLLATTTTPRPRVVHEQAHAPFAFVGGVTLLHPSDRVERVGFHEANHDGARQMEIAATAAAPFVMETRDRPTGSRTAADVVVDPDRPIRSPVSGTVRRAGSYVLYCDYSDDFVVIEPDDHPGWEVKLLHIDGVAVTLGERVEAGVTLLAPRPTRLAFESQVEEDTATPPWPHVHIEVVDPEIPDIPDPDGGCP
jgi:hypothetical protein